MLTAYQDKIKALLSDRDNALIEINAGKELTDTLQNREVYILSSCAVNLKSDLLDVTRAC